MNAIAADDPAVQRIRSLSRVLAAACLILIVLLPVALAVYWAVADVTALAVRANLPPAAVQGPLAIWQRVAGAMLNGVPLAMLLMGLWEARRCFRFFASGQVFAVEAVACLKRFAGWSMASVVAAVLAGAALSAVITLNNPPQMRHLAVSVGSDQLILLLFAGMVWLMAGVISQGQRLAEENASFV